MLDYWWDKRDERGLLLIESRCPPDNNPDFHNINAPGQTLSLAASLLRGSEVLTCTVVGFPLGATTTHDKIKETEQAITAGAPMVSPNSTRARYSAISGATIAMILNRS